MEDMFCNVEIEINSNCNRKCSYCPNFSYVRKEQGEMEEFVFIKIMDDLKCIGYSDRITFHFYGEPLLCRKLDKYVQITANKIPDAYPVLFTNGDFLSRKRLEGLEQFGIKYFVVTQQEEWRNGFRQIYNSLPEKLKEKVFYRTYNEIDYNNRGGLIDKKNIKTFSYACTLPSTMLQITLKGNVLPCCNDYEQLNVMGNVCEKSLLEIWESNSFKEFRHNLLEGNRQKYMPCKNCDIQIRRQ